MCLLYQPVHNIVQQPAKQLLAKVGLTVGSGWSSCGANSGGRDWLDVCHGAISTAFRQTPRCAGARRGLTWITNRDRRGTQGSAPEYTRNRQKSFCWTWLGSTRFTSWLLFGGFTWSGQKKPNRLNASKTLANDWFGCLIEFDSSTYRVQRTAWFRVSGVRKNFCDSARNSQSPAFWSRYLFSDLSLGSHPPPLATVFVRLSSAISQWLVERLCIHWQAWI